MKRLRLALLLGGAALAPACGSEGTNPFDTFSRLEGIPDQADLVFVSNLHAGPGALREAFALDREDGEVTRLTFCTENGALCDTLEAAPNRDRARLALRRVPQDIDSDGVLTEVDGVALLVAQLELGFESPFTPVTALVTGMDWSPGGDLLVYSGSESLTEGQDLFRIDGNGQNNTNLTQGGVPPARHVRPRVDPLGQVAVYARSLLTTDEEGDVVDRTEPAKSEIWIFQNTTFQFQVTGGGPGSEPLPGTPFVVGSDTDPVFDPQRTRIAFRRLTGLGNGGLGSWDLITVGLEGEEPLVLAAGPQHRSAPDWGPQGIVFVETDFAARTRQVVVVQPDGSGREILLTVSPEVDLDFPRWLAPLTVPATARR